MATANAIHEIYPDKLKREMKRIPVKGSSSRPYWKDSGVLCLPDGIQAGCQGALRQALKPAQVGTPHPVAGPAPCPAPDCGVLLPVLAVEEAEVVAVGGQD